MAKTPFSPESVAVTSESFWSSEKLADHLDETLNAPENLFTEATQEHVSESQLDVNCKWCEKCQEWSSVSPGLWFPATRNTRDRSSHAHWPEVQCVRVWLSTRGRENPASLRHHMPPLSSCTKCCLLLFLLCRHNRLTETHQPCSQCVYHRADEMHAHWIFLSQFVIHLYFRVYMYGCTCVCMDSLI